MPPEKKAADDIVIEIIEDGPQQADLFDFSDEPVKEPDKKPAERAEKPEKKADKKADEPEAVRKMKESLEAAKKDASARAAAEAAARKRAAELEAELATVRKRQQDAEGEAITSSKAAAQSEAERLQGELETAWEAGEYKKAAELQRKLARAEAVLFNLDSQEASHKQQATEPVKGTPVATATDPLEQFIAKMPERMKQWFRDHPEAFHDEETRHKAFAADVAARKKGLPFDSDPYYDAVNKYLGFVEDKEDEDDVSDADDEEETPRRKPAAPVSRESATPVLSDKTVRLTRQQVEIAESLGMNPKRYAEQFVLAKKDGKIT